MSLSFQGQNVSLDSYKLTSPCPYFFPKIQLVSLMKVSLINYTECRLFLAEDFKANCKWQAVSSRSIGRFTEKCRLLPTLWSWYYYTPLKPCIRSLAENKKLMFNNINIHILNENQRKCAGAMLQTFSWWIIFLRSHTLLFDNCRYSSKQAHSARAEHAPRARKGVTVRPPA